MNYMYQPGTLWNIGYGKIIGTYSGISTFVWDWTIANYEDEEYDYPNAVHSSFVQTEEEFDKHVAIDLIFSTSKELFIN